MADTAGATDTDKNNAFWPVIGACLVTQGVASLLKLDVDTQIWLAVMYLIVYLDGMHIGEG